MGCLRLVVALFICTVLLAGCGPSIGGLSSQAATPMAPTTTTSAIPWQGLPVRTTTKLP